MPPQSVTVYTYTNCSTCREAVKWLREQRIDFVEKPTPSRCWRATAGS
jgi:arsenate reductase-like glutaredoxin family protein